MKIFHVSQTELDNMISHWRRLGRVYTPAAGRQPAARPDCTPGWQPADGSPLALAAGPSPTSVKIFFFPQPETMQTFTLKGDDPDRGLLKESENRTRQIVVGLRPCDARSVLLNNLPYAEDPYFQANLARTALVGFTCDALCATCFCDKMGGSPMGTEGLDIAISRQEQQGFVAEILTAKGEELVAGLNLAPAEESAVASLAARRAAAPGPDAASLDTLKARQMNRLYEAGLWRPLGESCINCGACTFICPTCYCFDVQDEVVRGVGRRIRYWDSCMFPLYSLHTSGHNPRGQKMQRTRNRFMHKLKYFPDRFGPFSCVGCGRCVKDCPVNIDIREVMSDLLTVE
jgi:ferredoxin